MRFPSRLLACFSVLCVLLVLSACGKKGNLYLPDTAAHPPHSQTQR